MAMWITDECTACGLCETECPTGAIAEGDVFVIDPDVCNECEDQTDGPHCIAVCPIECIEKVD